MPDSEDYVTHMVSRLHAFTVCVSLASYGHNPTEDNRLSLEDSLRRYFRVGEDDEGTQV